MSELDPTAASLGTDVIDQELSIEEVVQMQSHEAVMDDELHEPELAESVDAFMLRRRKVSGRYRGSLRSWELELRVDVDGFRPMKRVSGDYYHKSGSTVSYFGSFVVNSPTISATATQVKIVGVAETTWATTFNKLRVVIPRRYYGQPRAAAHAQWMNANNKRGTVYVCPFESKYFRTVDLEQDQEKGVTPFPSYATGSLPSGGPARTLDVTKAYAEAGIEMRTAGVSNVVESDADGIWTNAELHAAMEKHFSLWKDDPQWKVWLFHAMRHEKGPGLRGIMFDRSGKQRQGCAAFYQVNRGTTPTKLRNQLYVCVHELGHCFNLYHSFHKKFMDPPVPNRLSANSWMNYPHKFPGGSTAFWSAFGFQFDNQEIIHLRHAFRNNIIMGGNPFGKGAALEDSVVDNSGLRLVLDTPRSFAFGEPVVAEIKLYLTDGRGKPVHKYLHPNFGFVQVVIEKPGGEVITYQPLLEHCVNVETTILDENQPSIYESAYIGYDKNKGHIFDSPGVYKLRGVYYALDGSIVLSNIWHMRVRAPLSQEDDEVAELFLGEEQGTLLYLLGSDSDSLQKGNDAFDLVLDKHANHPMAVYADLVKGTNASRPFKTITADKKVQMREPQTEEAVQRLGAVVDACETEGGVDNITLNQTMQQLARTQIMANDEKAARATITQFGSIFRKKKLKPHVEALIKSQQAELRSEL